MAARVALCALLLLALSACGSARVSQFDGFAAAGIKFADTLPAVYDQSFETSVRTDSLILREARRNLPPGKDRLDEIGRSNKNLAARLAILGDLKAHAAGLRAYFVALKALATTDAASGLTQATKDLTASLGKLDQSITKATVGGLSINDFLGQAVPIAVAQYQSAALNAELKERAGAIERELNLQGAALSALAAAMKSELGAQLAVEERDEIVLPYARDGNLPGDWNEKRLQGFRRRLDLSVVDAAVNAAANLRLSYVALVENRLDEGSMALLITDVNQLIALVEGVKAK
jgi:hypothetical protein